jgi:hypothetical protein
MGNWYKNITVSGSQADVVAVLQAHDRQAYVTPTLNGVTVVFDRASDDSGSPEEVGDLAMTLSHELKCPALAAAVFDDDVLLLGLYDQGAQVGEYNSAGPSTLRASSLSRAFRAAARAPLVWALLACPRIPMFIFESFRHRLLLRLLKHPAWAFATGYKYISRGEPPEDLESNALLHVNGQAPR